MKTPTLDLIRKGIKMELLNNRRTASILIIHSHDWYRVKEESFLYERREFEFMVFEGLAVFRTDDIPEGTFIIK